MNFRFRHTLAGVIAVLLAASAGCSRKPDVTPIAGWDKFQDPYVKLSFAYPKGWHVSADGKSIGVYSNQEVQKKFFDPSVKAPDGAQVMVSSEKLEKLQPLASIMDEVLKELKTNGFKIRGQEKRTVGGNEALQITFSGAYSSDTKVQTTRLLTLRDSVLYTLTYSAFNDYYAPYLMSYDSLLASISFPKPKTAEETANPALPSSEFEVFDNYAVKVSYPNNFETATPKPRGEATFSLEMKGYRQDCSIHLDILPSKGQTVEKAFEQNKKFYKVQSTGESKIDGMKAMYVNYSPAKSISSRAYFFVKGEKLIRTIMNYYDPMKADFVPVFEKVISTIHVK